MSSTSFILFHFAIFFGGPACIVGLVVSILPKLAQWVISIGLLAFLSSRIGVAPHFWIYIFPPMLLAYAAPILLVRLLKK
jgi:hypothetical protein